MSRTLKVFLVANILGLWLAIGFIFYGQSTLFKIVDIHTDILAYFMEVQPEEVNRDLLEGDTIL